MNNEYRFLPKYKKISGLESLSIHRSKKYEMVIILMGERHSRDGVCDDTSKTHITAKDFLYRLLRNNNYAITKDLFIEHNYSPESDIDKRFNITRPSQSSYMLDVIGELMDIGCIRSDIANPVTCKFYNTRFHNIDIRALNVSDPKVISGQVFYMSYIYISISKFFEAMDTRDYLSTEWESIMNSIIRIYKGVLNKSEFINNLYNSLDSLKIRKQLRHIVHPKIKRLLNKYIDGKIEMVRNNDVEISLSKIKDICKELRMLYKLRANGVTGLDNIKSYETVLNTTLNVFSDITISMMDVYVMARIFRRFRNNETCNNIIIYAGDLHIQNYRSLLNRIGFQMTSNYNTYNNPTDKTLCLDIEPLEIDWFRE